MADGMINPRFADLIDESAGGDFEIGLDPFAVDPTEFSEMTLEDGTVVRVNREGYLETQPDGQYLETDAIPDDGGYLAVNPDWLEEQWKMLSKQPWFRGDSKYRREDAIAELKHQVPGAFVVRVSFSQPGHYAISAKTSDGKVQSMLILPSFAGPESDAPGRTQYRLGSTSTLVFNTIVKLVKYYSEHNYYKKERLRGEILPESQRGGYMMVTPNEVLSLKKGARMEPHDSYMDVAPTGVGAYTPKYFDPTKARSAVDEGYFPVAPGSRK